MKSLNVLLDDKDFKRLKREKQKMSGKKIKMSWKQFFLQLAFDNNIIVRNI
jgi:uncharacterized membrane protein (DUF106 family)